MPTTYLIEEASWLNSHTPFSELIDSREDETEAFRAECLALI